MTAPSHKSKAFAARQRGAVLFVSLIFLLALTLLGVMMARSQTTEERMAQNDANHDMAIEAAGTALRYAEMNIATGTYSDFEGNTAGLYQLDPANGSVYTSAIWNTPAAIITYNGSALASVPTQPQLIVEQLPPVEVKGDSLGACAQGVGGNGCAQVFQITAHASGGDQTGQATLRSIYMTEN